LRSWAVKDYAPDVPQYVQVFLAETKMHLEHAELVICEDEFKYSLLANNCICPGIVSYFLKFLIESTFSIPVNFYYFADAYISR
jgi:hypothetical protein